MIYPWQCVYLTSETRCNSCWTNQPHLLKIRCRNRFKSIRVYRFIFFFFFRFSFVFFFSFYLSRKIEGLYSKIKWHVAQLQINLEQFEWNPTELNVTNAKVNEWMNNNNSNNNLRRRRRRRRESKKKDYGLTKWTKTKWKEKPKIIKSNGRQS